MKVIKLAAIAAVAITGLALPAAPALAQHHGDWHNNRHHGHQVCRWVGHGHHRHRECHWVR